MPNEPISKKILHFNGFVYILTVNLFKSNLDLTSSNKAKANVKILNGSCTNKINLFGSVGIAECEV